MAKYGGFTYRGAYYGEIPRLPFSVEPFQAVAIDYDKVVLSWGTPQGAVNGLRLVRNQDGFGEWPEDGVVLFERSSDGGDFGENEYTDGIDNFQDVDTLNDIPLVPGRFVFYRMWVRRTATNLWTVADDVVVVLPKQHGTSSPDGTTLLTTHDAFMDMLPRVYTSKSQSPLGVVDTGSDLYNFLRGFSFTIDEFLTLTDLLLPDFTGRFTNPALLKLQVKELGITPEDDDVILTQKRMVREAFYMYSRKGTVPAIGALVEALTGFAPVITATPNLMLTNQDSTFNNSVGSWQPYGGCTIVSTSEIIPPSGEQYAVESNYCSKVTVSTAGSYVQNGKTRTITRGIPVDFGTEYTFSLYAQSASAVEISPTINWHDSAGEIIATTSVPAPIATTGAWGQYTHTATAPGTQYLGTSYSISSNVVTINFDDPHALTIGLEIQVVGLGIPIDGKQTIDGTTTNSISFTLATSVPDESGTSNSLVSSAQAKYASVQVDFNTTGIVYLDLVQFADSSVTDFYEARGVSIFLNPSKSNYINNPSFSDVTGGWTNTGGTISYVSSTLPYLYAGDKMLELVTPTGAWEVTTDTNTGGMPVGKYYTFSIYAQGAVAAENVRVRITAIDSVNPSVSAESEAVSVGADWERLSVTVYVSSEFVPSSLFFTLDVFGTATGNTLNFDAAQLEATFAPSLYIDGSFPAEYGLVWEDLPNDSPSHLYKNKQSKVIRLIQELENFLPSNTPYVVESFGGIETLAITR